MGSPIHSQFKPNSNNWYTETELRRGTITWPLMIDSFELTFSFESEYPSINQALDIIKTKIFEDYTLSVHTQPEWAIQLEDALKCYNFAVEPEDEDEDPHSINIPESEGTRDVDGPKLQIPAITDPIKIKKINIGTDTEPKFASIETIGTMKQSDRLQTCYMTIRTYFPPSSQR